MIKPVFTEKSLMASKLGKYTFQVGISDNKASLKSEINKLFGVHVTSIKTMKTKGEAKRTMKGKNYKTTTIKKAIVTLKAGEKIDLFEESKK